MDKIYDMIIIGGGPAGYTAALYGARAGLSTLVMEKMVVGGQMALTDKIDNYPGFEDGIEGLSLGEKMKNEAERSGARTVFATVLSADLKSDPKVIKTSDDIFYGRTVVIATGAEPRELGVAMEKELVGRGVSYCATCDGMFFKGKTVVVVGGGNTAAADILLLSRVASKVFVVHRRDTMRASKTYHETLMKAENVEFCWDSQVTGILSDDKVTGVRIKNINTGDERKLSCDGIFVAIGRKPASELAAGQLDLDERGYVITDESTKTNIPGVFAAGDVRTKVLRQVITAASDGAMAAHYTEEYLAGRK
ncbi:MAG: thioredoxin-disulfide reductase [Firmicutes bacterium]|nr:thioredoxin-disulfide reductase [Bacillota bacterium]